MTTFYLVRHGETLFNKRRIIQGWVDSPLTELGIKQANHARKQLEKVCFDAVFCSTQERAFDTASIIAGDRNQIYQKKAFKECYFGDIDGLSIDEYIKGPVKVGFGQYGGELFANVALRYKEAMLDIAKEYKGNVLIVGHGRAIHSFLCSLDPKIEEINLPISKIIPNCSVTVIEYDGKFHIKEIGNENF